MIFKNEQLGGGAEGAFIRGARSKGSEAALANTVLVLVPEPACSR
jgi:hypothetical protein